MIHNRKSTTSVVSSWRNYLQGNLPAKRKNLNEAAYSPNERNEFFEALIADLTECGWDVERIDTLVSVLERCNPSDEELEMIGYGKSELNPLNYDEDLSV